MKTISWRMDFMLIIISVGTLFTLFLGSRALGVPDEGRYAEIPREMLANHQFLIPLLNGLPYFEKPALFYWLQTGAISLFGLGEWALRLVTMLMGLSGCVITYAAARRTFSRRCGLLATVILATSTLYYLMARYITVDMTLSFFITASLLCFWLAIPLLDQPKNKQRQRLLYGMYIASACAVLTKGLIGLALPGLVIFLWFCLTGRWQRLKHCCLPSGILLFLLITLPWHMLVQLQQPDFFNFYVVKQQILRFATPYAGREQAFWFLPAVLGIGLLPWSPFLVQAFLFNINKIRRAFRVQSQTLFLILWPITIFTFFSFSHSLLIPYLLPILPPCAILIAHYVESNLSAARSRGMTTGFIVTLIIYSAVFCAGYVYASGAHYLDNVTGLLYFSLMAASSILSSLAAVYYYIARKNLLNAFILLALGSALLLTLANPLYPYLDQRSVKPLAQVLKPLLKADEEVVCYHHYYQDLPVYLERRVSVVGWRNELTYGIQHKNATDWIYNDKKLWERWQQPKRMYMIVSHKYFRTLRANKTHAFYVLAQTADNILTTNQPMQSITP